MRHLKVRTAMGAALVALVAAVGISSAEAAAVPTVTALSASSGSPLGGATVTIQGTGFTDVSSVSFREVGDAPSFKVNSPTSITAVTPYSTFGAQTVDVIVYVRGGSAHSRVTPGDRFTFTSPTVSRVSPSSGGLRGGNTVIITGTGFTNAGDVFFTDVAPAPSYKVNSDTSITAVVPASQVARTTDVQVVNSVSGSDVSAGTGYTWVAESSSLKVAGVTPAAGPSGGGNNVTITGAGFVDVSSVTFNGARSPRFKVNSPTSITAVAPEGGTGTNDVVVHVRRDSAASLVSASARYTFLPPTVTGVSRSFGPRTGGSTVTITGTALANATEVLFAGVDADSFRVNSDTSITAVVPRSLYTFSSNVQVWSNGLTALSRITAANGYTYLGWPPPGKSAGSLLR